MPCQTTHGYIIIADLGRSQVVLKQTIEKFNDRDKRRGKKAIIETDH